MSLRSAECPGCTDSGQCHLPTCESNRPLLQPPTLTTYATAAKLFTTKGIFNLESSPGSVIEQKLLPSSGAKLVCTSCGRADWHVLLLRRKAGLIEGLCKQTDGSGCYPLASRRACQYTYPEQVDCPQLAEYCVALGVQRQNPKQVCRDHVGEMMRQGPLYLAWPLED